jgi:IS605 OrfB family transposase
MSGHLREIAPPFVVDPPAGARVRTRLKVTDTDAAMLMAIGTHLGVLAGRDLAERCSEGRLSAKEKADSRRERKRSLTAASSSRWAGAITRTSEDAFGLALRNLVAERQSLRARIAEIERRLAIPKGQRLGRLRGYATRAERFQKQRRLQVLCHRLAVVEARIEEGRVSVCRGAKALARAHHHLDDAGLSEAQWQEHWRAERLFLTADGEKDQLWGNLTIRWHPDEHWVEIALPQPLVHLANRPHGRYRLACPVAFNYRGDEVASQAATGAVRYDISCDPSKGRWYIDASWKSPPSCVPDLDQLREQRVLAVDLNKGHLAAMVVDPSGNPVGRPITVPLDLAGVPAPTRDGHLRQAVSVLIATAKAHGCRAIVTEDLDFKDARELGRERRGNRPSRGRRGKSFRHTVAGIPTAKFRDRLVQMAANAGLSVIAVDPAYTSQWGAEHWLCCLQKISVDASGHHAAAVVIARRGLGQQARQRRRCDLTSAEHGEKRATRPVVRSTVAGCPAVLSEQRMRDTGTRKARGQPHLRRKTQPAERDTPVDQVTQDRSGPPARRDSVPLSV